MKALASLAWAVQFAGCSQQQGSAPASEEGYTRQDRSPVEFPQDRPLPPDNRQGAPQVQERAKLTFLQRIREADPQFQTIERAVMNESSELGIILSREVSMDDIPALMRALLKQMAAQFPGENLTVVAYAPTNPPMTIGTGRLDARSREMTYIPAQQQRR